MTSFDSRAMSPEQQDVDSGPASLRFPQFAIELSPAELSGPFIGGVSLRHERVAFKRVNEERAVPEQGWGQCSMNQRIHPKP